MSEALNNLNDEYKQMKKEATSKEEKQQIKQDYKEMKTLIKGADKLIQKHDQELRKFDKVWDKLDKEYQKLGETPTFEEVKEKLNDNQLQFEEQKKHSDELIRQADETIKRIDEKLAELDKEKIIMDNKDIRITLKEYISNSTNDDIKLSFELFSKHFLPSVKPHTIFYKNEQINDEDKYKNIIDLIYNNIDNIKKLNMLNINSYKGGLQEVITIQIDSENYVLIGNTDNQEMKQLYNTIKNEILKIIEKNEKNDYFTYRQGDIQFGDSQCDFCKYNDLNNKSACIKYPNGKPNNIINTEVKCEYLEMEENKKMDNNITFEQAKKIANEEANKHGKIIETIEENDEYWLFKAGFEDGHVDFDDGVGSIYISKIDGSTRGLNLWDMDFTRKFKESAKVIYNYSDNK